MNRRINRRLRFFLQLTLAGLLALIPVTAWPQVEGEDFEDPDHNYTLKLPKNWSAIVSKNGAGRNEVNIVFRGVREEGALQIRTITVEPGTKVMEAAKRDEEQTLRFRPGYVKGAIENFAAGYSGALVSYDYTLSGRPKMGRKYYLLVNETTVYALWFSGNRPTMGPLRAQTDLIARSFKTK